jgi:hypothetical protein
MYRIGTKQVSTQEKFVQASLDRATTDTSSPLCVEQAYHSSSLKNIYYKDAKLKDPQRRHLRRQTAPRRRNRLRSLNAQATKWE